MIRHSTVYIFRHSTVCRQVQSGVQAIFGPTDASLSAHIQSVSDALDIPHIQIRVDLEPPVEYALSPDQSPDSVNAANKNGYNLVYEFA